MKLLISQKNELYALLERYGFCGADFRYRERRGRRGRIEILISYRKIKQYSFAISYRGSGTYRTVSRPAAERIRLGQCCTQWQEVTVQYCQWLQCVQKETAQPDLWANARQPALYALASQIARLNPLKQHPAISFFARD